MAKKKAVAVMEDKKINVKKFCFKKNDLVFAKMRGYCTWPAKIVSIENSRVQVYFFGTHDTYVTSVLSHGFSYAILQNCISVPFASIFHLVARSRSLH